MIELRDGEPCDVDSLTQLVYESAPILLPYLFGSQQNAFDYISQAMLNPDGQYSARRHCVAANALKAEACVTLWHSHMPTQFHEQTLKSLAAFLQVRQLAHLGHDDRVFKAGIFQLLTKRTDICRAVITNLNLSPSREVQT